MFVHVQLQTTINSRGSPEVGLHDEHGPRFLSDLVREVRYEMTSYRDSKVFGIDDICRLLEAVDRHLTVRAAAIFSSVADVPWNYEARLERQLPELVHLQVWILYSRILRISLWRRSRLRLWLLIARCSRQ